ncbi:TPA: helix-turn-helix transcriptional regulator [Stenotrophomonas maltophilia]
MDIAELLDLAQARTHAEYDSALARKLGVSRQTISNWRVGRTFPDAKACGRISEATGMPLNEIMGLVGEERATDQEEKAVWRRLAGRAAAILVAVSAGTFAQPNQAQATAFKGFSGSDQPHSVYYVQSIPGDAGVPFASIPSRPGSYGFLHRPIRVLCMPQAIQPQTKPTPRDNDLFLFKGGSIQSLIGHESQRSQ